MSRPTLLAPAYVAAARGFLDLLGCRYPTEFSDATAEHRAVRQAAGLFDFSFMTHVVVRGPDALTFVQHVITNDASRLRPARGLYSPLCDERGGIVDDCTVIRRADQYLVTCGLASAATWLAAHASAFDVVLEDRSRALAVLAVQGPASAEVLAAAGFEEAGALAYFDVTEARVDGLPALLARLGYTGELGFEVFAAAPVAANLWRRLVRNVQPCGGLALDSLRIEAGYLMTRVDFDPDTTPYEAGLGHFVRLDKGDFIGRAALATGREATRRITGLQIAGDVVPARGAAVRDARRRVVGRVTSACTSPVLGRVLALAYVAEDGQDPLSVEGIPSEVFRATLPFYAPSRERLRMTAARTI